MANYIPTYTKKLEMLKKQEERLRRLVCHGAERKNLLNAAEDVRLARIRMLKARKATIPPDYGPQDSRIATIDDNVLELQNTSAETILAEFESP
jgi:hypothetical protein